LKHRWLGAGEADAALVAKYASQLDATLAVYDVILAKQKYIGGDKFTLADIYHLPYGKLAIDAGFGATFEKKPNVWAWWQRCTERESWKKVVAGQV
jgi:glutathione S-transferase